MMNTRFAVPRDKGLNILLLGAHSDDIEIGCGGTILKLIKEYKIEAVQWVVFCSNKVRKKEAEESAKKFLKDVKQVKVEVYDFKDGFLPAVWSEVKATFEQIKKGIDPDLIFTHYRNDLHQDHRTLNELTWNTFRDHVILEYEIPKYDGDLGKPNMFVPLSQEQAEKKKKIITKCFNSQSTKQWFDDQLLTSMLRIRGVECASKTKYAEAFYSRKLTM